MAAILDRGSLLLPVSRPSPPASRCRAPPSCGSPITRHSLDGSYRKLSLFQFGFPCNTEPLPGHAQGSLGEPNAARLAGGSDPLAQDARRFGSLPLRMRDVSGFSLALKMRSRHQASSRAGRPGRRTGEDGERDRRVRGPGGAELQRRMHNYLTGIFILASKTW